MSQISSVHGSGSAALNRIHNRNTSCTRVYDDECLAVITPPRRQSKQQIRHVQCHVVAVASPLQPRPSPSSSSGASSSRVFTAPAKQCKSDATRPGDKR